MTNLTDKWKKGELPDGEDYYIKWKDSEVFTATFVDFMGRKMFQRMELEFEELPIEHYLSVLAPVPSYEEWQASENYIDYLKQCISVYESKDKQATETSIAYNELLEENTKLKELLKKCKHIMSIEKDFASCHFEKDKLCKLLTKINQVLGEE